ncbi:ABC transporter ATP-binding protein [Celeribacter indicus]|uniref:Glutathione import ATP-binding protein GsiA n=1 Tax=Celeribacter indicus TaxID=1208324 RepID=A0A0B5E049_9RHOB|nr:ABC transporter ATP-binding protein [Celeribacter indicus]AJE46371.1 ABC transporter [Celeribacter indicus]SDW54834.1 peptide/nickel transport system ATP-binding protein [Celeribacter indicus]
MNAIEVRGLDVVYGEGEDRNHVVRALDFDVRRGETLGIVGESGCGKSTVLRCLIGLERGWTGEIRVEGSPMSHRRTREELRKVQLVFQDPFASLHPRHRIGRAVSEPLRCMGVPVGEGLVGEALEQVGLPADFADRFPHELSGGQRQRVAIARALVLEPPILLLDEPTSALDVSVQAEVLNLLSDKKESEDLTYVMVSHDLSVIAHMCDRILVMKEGKFVDEFAPEAIAARKASDPYAQHLIDASFV